MVNVHFSLLPRWRGAAPVERAILEGDAETGVCLMAVEAGLDTGGIYAEDGTVIGEEETADELRSRLVAIGCRLLVEHLADGAAGLPPPRDQVGTPSYAEKILPAERQLRWDQPARQLHRVVRIGRAWTTFRGHRLGILAATADDGTAGRWSGEPGSLQGTDVVAGDGYRIALVTVQPEGRRPMDAEDWLRGVRPEPGERLGT
jgi:methionyl-tRNA formyltransferase